MPRRCLTTITLVEIVTLSRLEAPHRWPLVVASMLIVRILVYILRVVKFDLNLENRIAKRLGARADERLNQRHRFEMARERVVEVACRPAGRFTHLSAQCEISLVQRDDDEDRK